MATALKAANSHTVIETAFFMLLNTTRGLESRCRIAISAPPCYEKKGVLVAMLAGGHV